MMTAGDKATNSKGNVAGASQVLAAATTGRWWVWTGENGSQYIDSIRKSNGFVSSGSLLAP